MKGDVYKDYYPISDAERYLITVEETAEEIEAYFAYLEACKHYQCCSECGQLVEEFDKTWTKDEIREYSISALCKDCQRRLFGI